jgi:sugar/nucleoside kinase (ribokinase family)
VVILNQGAERHDPAHVMVGELNLDLILYGLPEKLELEREILASNLSITLGSSSAIFAHNLARMGDSVGFNSSIGGDPLGEICLQRLREGGVDLSGVRRFAEKTTGLTVILPQGKERFILTYPGTMAEMSIADLDFNQVFNAKHLHLSSYFLQKGMQPGLPELSGRPSNMVCRPSFDTNDDPRIAGRATFTRPETR